MLILHTILVFLAIRNTKQYENIYSKQIIPYNPASYKLLYKGPDGEVRYKDDCECLYLSCYGSADIYDGIPIIKNTLHAKILYIFECTLPPTPILETLTSLNINASNVKAFGFSRVTKASPMAKGNYMIGMNITTLSIASGKETLNNNQDILNTLNHLKTLHIQGTKVPPIPAHLKIEDMQISHSVLLQNWDNCQYLKLLKIMIFTTKEIPSIWPSNCTSLIYLFISSPENLETTNLVLSTIGVHCVKLLNLTMEYSELNRLPNEILNIAKDLKYLNLKNNFIDDNAFSVLPLLDKLTVLDITSNRVTGIFLSDIVEKLPALKELIIYDNFIITNSFCTFGIIQSLFPTCLSSLERLSLNRVTPDCLKDFNFNNLTYLGLQFQDRINNLKIEDLPKTNASFLDIDMGESFVERIEFDENDYNALNSMKSVTIWKGQSRGPNLTISFKHIDCDCENYWFALALTEYPALLSLPNLKCYKSERNFMDEDLMVFNCTKEIHQGCVARKRVQHDINKPNKTMTVECHKKDNIKITNSTFDDSFKFTELDVSGNEIKTLNNIWMPPELKSIDLRSNSISRLDENDTRQLFNSPKRRVWMGGNILLCDCESKSMLDAFHLNKEQIVDFDNLICVDSDKPLSSITSYEACHIESRILIGMLVAILVVLLVLAAVLWQHRFKIKLYVYDQGWCLFCLTEEEDQDRPYDAFLSFAHEDWDYVVDELLPKLEGEPDEFRVCVHYRDWVVGDWIPNQIMRSVNLSKRTIIVLSKNFITSLWSTLEFRYAVASSANEGHSRLLVIVLDDVLQQVLDPELVQYLNYNTYLHYKDSWFWEKLRYAMPYRRGKRNQTERTADIHNHMPSDGHGIIDVNSREVFIMEPLAIGQ